MMPPRSIRRSLTLTLALTAACSATDPLFDGRRAHDHHDAGSVHLSVLAVAPWSDYAAAMQPDFQLSADGALAKVAADNRWALQERTGAVQAGEQSVALDRASGGARPLEVPSFRPPLLPGDPASTAVGPYPPPVPPAAGGQELATGPDAMLKYTAATALYQEVQLLNRYIRDAAIPNGYRQYMVRLQVSLMPSRRHAPYDAYTTISFFVPGDRVSGAAEDVEPAADSSFAASNTDRIFEEPFGNGPKVLPLLVTDNLEASVEARSLDRIRSLVYSMVEFPGSSVVEQMLTGLVHNALREQVLGRDLNSLLTVARLSENTLRIRIGAVQEATSNYAMVPRNHNITLLLMVPEGSPPLMEVVSRTELVDAETGEVLDSSDERRATSEFRRLLAEGRVDGLDEDALERLLGFAERNDQRGFSRYLRECAPAALDVGERERDLWIRLVSLLAGSQRNSHLFELPGQGEDVAVSRDVFLRQTLVVEDDGQQARVILREARFPGFERMLATLSVPDAAPSVLLPARAIQLDPSRRELRLSFSSPQRLGLFDGGAPAGMQLELSIGGETRTFDVRYREVGALEQDLVESYAPVEGQ